MHDFHMILSWELFSSYKMAAVKLETSCPSCYLENSAILFSVLFFSCISSDSKRILLATFQRKNVEPRKVGSLSTFRSSKFSAATILIGQLDRRKFFRFDIFRLVKIRHYCIIYTAYKQRT